jgi:hypothetical protein
VSEITFPRDKPDELKAVGLRFQPEPMIEQTPLRSGRIISADLGPTLWRASWTSPAMEEAEFGIVRGWYDTLLGLEAFNAYDLLREYPLAYAGGWPDFGLSPPFDGTCVLGNVVNARMVTLVGLPDGFVLSPGDYISFAYGTDSLALHRVVAGGAVGSPPDLEIEVRPWVRPGWEGSPAPVVNLYRPSCHMKIIPGSWSENSDAARHGRVSFEAVQTI